jgi:hypothetical protein
MIARYFHSRFRLYSTVSSANGSNLSRVSFGAPGLVHFVAVEVPRGVPTLITVSARITQGATELIGFINGIQWQATMLATHGKPGTHSEPIVVQNSSGFAGITVFEVGLTDGFGGRIMHPVAIPLEIQIN